MTSDECLIVLMGAASHQARGYCLSEQQQKLTSEAWAYAFEQVYKKAPGHLEYLMSGMTPPENCK